MKTNFVTLIAAIFCFAITGLAHSKNSSIELFELTNSKSSAPNTQLYFNIRINNLLRKVSVGDTLSIPIPGEAPIDFDVARISKTRLGNITIAGRDNSNNDLLLTVGAKLVFGHISGANMRYAISYIPATGQVLVNQRAPELTPFDLGEDGKIPPHFLDGKTIRSRPKIGKLQLSKAKSQAKTMSEITLLAIYSPEFATGFGDPLARINQMIAFTNASFSRSGIFIRLKLARAQQLNFPNGSGNGTLLDQVTNGAGAFSGIPALRDKVGADMVTVLRFLPQNFGSGIAWVNGDNDRFAFSVNQFSPVGFDSVFAHEIGHNLGSGHERASVNPSASGPCSFNLTGFSCGHGNQAAGWGTVMSRLNSGRVNHVFSNPALTCVGQPCGIPQGQSGAADNNASFNFARTLVENFREDPKNGSLPATIFILLNED